MPAAHKPTDEQRKQVHTLASFGVPQDDICKVVGVSKKTLELWYRDELDRAGIIASSNVAKNLYNIAMGSGREAVTACIFWLKCRARWHETAGVTEAMGKKELTEQIAKHSDEGTEWERLLN